MRIEYRQLSGDPVEERWVVAFHGRVAAVLPMKLVVHVTDIEPEFKDRSLWLGYIRLMYGRLISVDTNATNHRVSAERLVI